MIARLKKDFSAGELCNEAGDEDLYNEVDVENFCNEAEDSYSTDYSAAPEIRNYIRARFALLQKFRAMQTKSCASTVGGQDPVCPASQAGIAEQSNRAAASFPPAITKEMQSLLTFQVRLPTRREDEIDVSVRSNPI